MNDKALFAAPVGTKIATTVISSEIIAEAEHESHARCLDGRTYVLDQLSELYGTRHDIVLVAVPNGTGNNFALEIAGKLTDREALNGD